MKITKTQLRQIIKEEITKELDSGESLQENERGESYGGFYQDDMTDEEFEKFKKALSRAYRAGKRGADLKKVGDHYKTQYAKRKTPEFAASQEPKKFGSASKAEFGRGGKRIKKSSYGQSSPHVSGNRRDK